MKTYKIAFKGDSQISTTVEAERYHFDDPGFITFHNGMESVMSVAADSVLSVKLNSQEREELS